MKHLPGRGRITGHKRWLLVFALLFGIALAMPVLAFSAAGGAKEPTEGEAAEAGQPPLPDKDAISAALESEYANHLKEEKAQEEELESPASVAEREQSQGAYSELGPAQAEELIRADFGEALENLNGDTARTLSDSHVDHMAGTDAATVTSEGETQLLEATIPIKTENAEGEEAKVDLSLEENGASFEPENPLVELAIGKSVGEGVEVGEEGLTITQAGAEGATGSLMGDKNILYNEVAPGSDTDLMVSPISNGVELFDILRSADSPETLRFEVAVPTGSTLRMGEEETAEVVNAEGRATLIPKPWAEDAQGTEVPVTMQVEGDSLVLSVDHSGPEVAYPIMVDPTMYQDWGWWYAGQHLSGLGAFRWQSNAGWAGHGTQDYHFPEYWEKGLFISAPPANFGGGEFGQYIYSAPNAGSYLSDATVNPLLRRDESCGAAEVPVDYEGMWNEAYGYYRPGENTGAWYKLYYNDAKTQGYVNMGGGGEALIIGLSSGGGGSDGCWRDLMIGGVGIWLADHQAPTVSIGGLPTGWVKKDATTRTINVSATNNGLGVQNVSMTKPTSIGWNQPWCAGTYENRCPEGTRSGTISYNTSTFPEGEDPVEVIATDPAANQGSAKGTVKVDGAAPLLSLSGSLTEQATLGDGLNEYTLAYAASDGTASSPRSGVASTEVKLDGKTVEAKAPGCTTKNCPVSGEWKLDASQFGYGKHTVEVIATDAAGNKSVPQKLPIELLDVQQPPVAAYPLDEGTAKIAHDVSGNGHEGTISAKGAVWAPGKYGTSLKFDGSEGCVTIPDSPALRLREEFTLESWVRPEGELLHDPAIYKEATGFPSYDLGIGFNTAAKPEGQLGKEGATHQDVAATASLEANVWSDLAVTYDGAKLRLYVDGELVTTKAVEKANSASLGTLRIGCATGPGYHFRGRIDEIRIYNRALFGGEVAIDQGVPIQTPAAAPIAAYPLDEAPGATVARDSSGNEHEGTLSAKGTEWVPGKYGNSLKFDGKEGCVTVPDSTTLRLGEEFSLESWVKPEGELSQLPILYKAATGFPAYDLGIGLSTAGRGEGQIGTLAKSHTDAATPAALEAGVWQHLAVTWDGAKLRLYLNGKLVATTAVSEPNSAATGALKIGCGNGSYFRGRIDEVRIYNRAIGLGEVAADMAAPIQTPQATPVADYSFDENTGTVAHDSSGAAVPHDGTLTPSVKWAPGKYGSGLKFEGSEGCVTIPDATELQLREEFTLESWVKPEAPLTHMPAIYKESAEGFPSYDLGIGFNTAGRAEGQLGKEVKTHQDIASTNSLEAGVWSHLALTYDGVKLRLYVNGKIAATKVVEKPSSSTPGPLSIGCAALTGYHFKGQIDEVRIYNRALSEGEVAIDGGVAIQTPAAAPIAAYPLDANTGTVAADSSGNKHEGTLTKGVTWAPGKYGSSLQFTGSEGCVTIPDALPLQLGEEFSLESWVKPEGELSHLPILYKAGAGFPAYDLGIGLTTAGRGEGQIGTQAKSHSDAATPAALEAGVWQHLAVTWDGANLRLYLNGELAATKAVSEPNSGVAGALSIGCGGGYHFRGRIDEVRIYNRAIGIGEVVADMAAPIQTPQQPPVAAYAFEEGEGTTVEDVTGGLHEGALSAEGVSWAPGRYGKALKFDGAKGCVTIPDSPTLRLGEEFSLESWVRPEAPLSHMPAIFKESSEGFSSYDLGIGFNTTGKPEGQLGKEGKTHQDIAATASLEASAWSHLALTYDGVKLRLYVNGALVAAKVVEKPASSTPGPLTIGCAALTGYHFKGRIDEVRIYNRALSEPEVRQSMSAPLPRSATAAASDIGANDAILNGWVEANSAETEYFFEYGPTTGFGETVVGEEVESQGEKIDISEAIIDLSPETKYYYRLVGDSPSGLSYGKTMTLITGKRTMTAGEEKELREAEENFKISPNADADPLGTFYGMMWTGDLLQTENDYQAIEESGAKIIRLEVNFRTELPRTAEAFREAQAHHLIVLPYVTGADFPVRETPLWTKWMTYAQEVVETFGPNSSYGINTWEIWNEPNMPHKIEFKEGETPEQEKEKQEEKNETIEKVDPQDFGVFFRRMSEVMKVAALHGKNQQGIKVLAPGMYGYMQSEKNKEGELHQTPRKFLEAMVEAMGESVSFDAFSLHPYVFKVGKPGNRHEPKEGSRRDYLELSKAVKRSITNLHDLDESKPIWITELGFPVENTFNPKVFPPVKPAVQKALVRSSFSMMQNNRARLNIEHAFYYNIEDKVESSEEEKKGRVWEAHAGLLDASGGKRPAWYAFRCLAEELEPGEKEGEGKTCS